MPDTLDKKNKVYDDNWKPGEGQTKPGGVPTAQDSDLPASHPDNLEGAYDAPDAEYPEGHPSRDDIKNAEESGGGGSSGASSAKEKGLLDKSGIPYRDEGTGMGSKLRGKFTRKRMIGGGIGIGLVTGGIFGLSIMQGPLQFVHFGQLLQKFHFTQNDDFSGGRTSKVMLYSISGIGAERGRLGAMGNKFADRWENRMVEKAGLRPLYSNGTGRMVGYEIVDQAKASQTVSEIEGRDGVKTARYADLDDAEKALHSSGRGGNNRTPGNNTRIVYLGDTNMSAKRQINKIILNSINKTWVAAAMQGRVLKKRMGIKFHPLENVGFRQWLDDKYDKREVNKEKREEYKRERLAHREDLIKGTTAGAIGKALGDSDEEIREEVEKAKNSKTPITGEIARSLIRGGLAVGVLCAVKSVGDGVEDFKYTESYLKMASMGGNAIANGSQVQSGDVNTDELGALSEVFYDPESETSWDQANSIRQEQGKDPLAGEKYDIPKEARLDSIQDQGFVFEVLSNFPGLGTGCNVISGITDAIMPDFLQDLISDGATFVTDQALGLTVGITTEEAVQMAFSALAGQTVNVNAQGAEYGNLANAGAHYASNDQAMSMGGRALNNEEVAQLKAELEQEEKYNKATESLAQRYLNPADVNSLVGSLSLEVPSSFSQIFQSLVPEKLFYSIANIFDSPFSASKLQAASKQDIYGVAKFGFSLEEQNDERFEDPMQNAALVEPQLDDGENLNEKYGKCFGVRVHAPAGSDSITIENKEVGDDELNIFKTQEKSECQSSNSDEWFLRYRFYVADVMMMLTMACYEDDAEACAQLDIESAAASSASQTAGLEIDMANLEKDSSNIACAEGTKDIGVQDGYVGGDKVPIRVCAIQSVPETGGTSNLPGAGGRLLVNSRLSAFYVNMIQKAKDNGVKNISAQEGFRTMEQQQCFFRGGCGATGAAARPGYSNHQLGVAVDWSDSMIAWLNNNGSSYSLKALVPGEPWHWSPTGN